jgi:hypothetical protein
MASSNKKQTMASWNIQNLPHFLFMMSHQNSIHIVFNRVDFQSSLPSSMIDDLEIGPWIKDPNPVMIRSWKIYSRALRMGHLL